MDVSKTQGLKKIEPKVEVADVKKPSSETIQVFQGRDDIELTNEHMSAWTKESVSKSLEALKGNIELKQPWIGEDYIKFTGNGKMTYGQLRESLGIPPRVISNNNKGNFKDTDVIQGTVKIPLNGIGFFERRMDNIEAQNVRYQRNHGNAAAGWEKALPNQNIIDILER